MKDMVLCLNDAESCSLLFDYKNRIKLAIIFDDGNLKDQKKLMTVAEQADVPVRVVDVTDVLKDAGNFKDGILLSILAGIADNLNVQHVLTSSPRNGSCFTKNTLIRTLSGLKTVGELKVGDRIISYGFEKHDTDADEITKIVPVGIAQTVFRICTLENEVCLTGDHEVYVFRDGKPQKTHVRDILAGDTIYELGDEFNGVKRSYVQSITEEEYDDVVFDIEVKKNHNYFAGDHANILISNCSYNSSDFVDTLAQSIRLGTKNHVELIRPYDFTNDD